MIRNEPVRTFETPDVAGVASVSIHPAGPEDDKPFYATQYYVEDTFEDGTEWHNEREEYIQSETYRRAVAESTHIPVEDIRLKSLPVAEPHGVI